MQNFYGLELSNIQDIKHKIKVLKNRIPNECIPIAKIEGGDVLCLELSKQNYGRILLWEHEEELNEGYTDNVDLLRKVASTFEEFMKQIVPFEINDDDFKVKEIWIDPEFLKELGDN